MTNFSSDLAALKGQLPLKEELLKKQTKIAAESKIVPAVLKAKEKEIETVS